jgi:uncharacterized protein (TIGR02453 family)
MFRIYRDTRFSKDKSPYKTHAAAQFRHQAGKDVHAPGFYLHLAPGETFIGGGIWHPDGKTARKIRTAIQDDVKGWKKTTTSKRFRETYALMGDSLKRPPAGFPTDHPFIEDLKRKDFIAGTPFTEAEVCAPDFIDRFAEVCRTGAPFVGFLTTAIGLPW